MTELCDLIRGNEWQYAIAHLQVLADSDAVDEIFYHGVFGTTFFYACDDRAPLELVQLMLTTAKLDSRKRNVVSINYRHDYTPFHGAAYSHDDPAVLELLIREYPLALCAIDYDGLTPLQEAYLAFHEERPHVLSLLADTTNALASGDFAVLAARVHGDSSAIRRLCPLSAFSPSRFAVRIELLLCIKHG